jgi:E3 ubiquitin-protein ligase DOA10
MANHNEDQNESTIECRCCKEPDYRHNLMSPCACSGSLKYIHRNCLRQWMEMSSDSRTCNICKTKYNVQVIKVAKSCLEFICQDFAHSLCFLCSLIFTALLFFVLIHLLVMNLSQLNDYRVRRNMKPITNSQFSSYKLYSVSLVSSLWIMIWLCELIGFKSWQKDYFDIIILN